MGSRIIPVPTPVTAPYWDAARRRELALQRCGTCGRFTHPPQEECAYCGNARCSFEAVSGRGRVETFSVVYRTFSPGFADRVPYVIAWVALDEQPGLRVFGNVLGIACERVFIGMPVELAFEEINGYGPVPSFLACVEECA